MIILVWSNEVTVFSAMPVFSNIQLTKNHCTKQSLKTFLTTVLSEDTNRYLNSLSNFL